MTRCPSLQELERFLREAPAAAEGGAIADHVEGCEDCRRVLDDLATGADPAGSIPDPPPADDRDARLIDRLKEIVPGLDPGPGGSPGPDAGLDATEERPGPVVPLPEIRGFRVLREVGRGGMGVVYEAQELALNRRVALKVLPARGAADPQQVLRFEREARAAARLHHTRIVPVFGVGRQEEYYYYVMQFIDGRGLDRALDEWRRSPDRPSPRDVARIGLQVAEALEHAHDRGILHRDIKPSNLLLDAAGDVWVADFGLAKAPGEGEDVTETGDVLGTVRYMAPERFRGDCDRRSDVYALGLTLYELIAARPAFSASDRVALIEQVRRADPARLGEAAPEVPGDLETIVHKAIAAEPPGRYATAGELADDLRRFLEDRPIRARRASPAERMARWCRRNPWAAAFLGALALGMVASTWQAVRATRAEAAARDDRDRAERSFGRAVVAIRELLLLQSLDPSEMQAEELRPYRRALIEAGLRETHRLIGDLEGEPRLRGQLVEAYHALARIQAEAGERAQALESARKAVAVSEELLRLDPTYEDRRYLAYSLQALAQALDDPDASREAARRSSDVLRGLLAEAPSHARAEAVGMIPVNDYLAGDRLFRAGRPVEAIEEFLRARSASGVFLRDFGPEPAARAQLAATERYLCRALPAAGRLADAIAAGRRSVGLYEALGRERPDDFPIAWDLHLALEELGLRLVESDDPAAALPAFDRGIAVLERLDARPDLLASRRLAVRLAIAGLVHNRWMVTDKDPARFAAIRWAVPARVVEICGPIAAIRPLPGPHRRAYALACLQLAGHRERDDGRLDLDLLRRAERLYAESLRDEPGNVEARAYLDIARRLLADELVALGRVDEADTLRRRADRDAPTDPVVLFEIAREHGRYVLDAVAAPTATVAASRRRRSTRQALAALRAAAAAGLRDGSDFHDDPLLAPFRSMPEYRAIVGAIGFPADPFAP